MNLLKKGKFVRNVFFQIALNEILKNRENDDIKVDKKQREIKKLVAVTFYEKYLPNLK